MSKHSIATEVRRAKAEDKQARKRHFTVASKDSFQNFAAGIGIGTDNISSGGTYGFNPVTRVRQNLEWIYRGSWLGGMAVDVIAEDMTRAGVEIKGEIKPDQIDRIEESATTLKIWKAIADNVRWGRLYGGSIGVLLIDGQRMDTPLRMDTVGPGQFRGIYVLDRWQVNPSLTDLVRELGPTLGKPKYYTVVASQLPLSGQKIHFTRCIRHDAIGLPIWQAMTENMWGISVLERMWDRMVNFDSATLGAAQMTHRAYLRTYKIENLRENIALGGPGLEGLLKFVDMMRRLQSNEGITLLDKEDEFEAHSNSTFSGVSDVLVNLGQQLSGSLEIPLVRLFGQSPAGLSATGESDIRMYYDGILHRQNSELLVPVTQVYRLLAQSLGIKLPKGYKLAFRPLWQLSDQQKAEVANTVTTTIKDAHESGIISQQTAMQELKQSSTVTGVWSNITQEQIEDAEEELPPGPGELEQTALEEGASDSDEPERAGAPKTKKKTKDAQDTRDNMFKTVFGMAYFHDLHPVIESPKDSERSGGILAADYGYLPRHIGADGDQIDVFVAEHPEVPYVFIIDQAKRRSSEFDEHKVVMGARTGEEAMAIYVNSYDYDPTDRVIAMTEVPMDKFKQWLEAGDLNLPYSEQI